MESASAGASRLERILAYMVAGVVGLSILCFFAVLFGTWSGQAAAQQDPLSPWVWVIMFPYFGLPAGMLLVIALLIVSSLRRSREARAER